MTMKITRDVLVVLLISLVFAHASLAQTSAAASTTLAPDASQPADPLAMQIRQGFADSRYGQVHYLTSRPAATLPRAKWRTPLVMFHQSPLSAREFGPLIAAMGKDRVVIAFDTPGQGLSDGPERPVRMAEYAAVMNTALQAMDYGAKQPVDVFGHHTGVWVGGELAIQNPKLVRRIVFSGVYLVPETTWRANIAHLPVYNSSGEFFEGMATSLPRSRDYYVARGMSDADWGRMVVDTLTPRERREFVHIAAFSYAAEAETRLPLITQPVTLLLIDDGIAEQTRGAVHLFKHLNKVVERLDWNDSLFYTRTDEVAAMLREALD